MQKLNNDLLAKDITISQKDKIIDDLHQTISKSDNASGWLAADPEARLSNKSTSKRNASAIISKNESTVGETLSAREIDGKFKIIERINTLLIQASMAKKLGNLKEAMSNYRQVLDLKPDEATASVELAKLLIEHEDYHSAEPILTKGFNQHPNNQEILSLLGYTLIQVDKATLATTVLKQALAIHSENADLHKYFGLALLKIGNKETAEKELKQSFSLDSSNPDTAYNLAILYSEMSPPRIEEAKEWYAKAKRMGGSIDARLENTLK